MPRRFRVYAAVGRGDPLRHDVVRDEIAAERYVMPEGSQDPKRL